MASFLESLFPPSYVADQFGMPEPTLEQLWAGSGPVQAPYAPGMQQSPLAQLATKDQELRRRALEMAERDMAQRELASNMGMMQGGLTQLSDALDPYQGPIQWPGAQWRGTIGPAINPGVANLMQILGRVG